MRFVPALLILASLVFTQTSNSTVMQSSALTQYWEIDTSVIYKANIHVNRVSVFQFPARVKLVSNGNSAEISAVTDGNVVFVKPLLGTTRSNISVLLHSGHMVIINLETVQNNNGIARMVFSFPNKNDMADAIQRAAQEHQKQLIQALEFQRMELMAQLPDSAYKSISIYRCGASRKKTAVRHLGFEVAFDAAFSTNKHTYFVFTTNAPLEGNCQLAAVDSLFIKSAKTSRIPLSIEEFSNTGNKIIMRTDRISETPERIRLFARLKFYQESKYLKVDLF